MEHFARRQGLSKAGRAQEEEIFVGPSWRSIVFVFPDVVFHYAARLLNSAAKRLTPA